MNTYLSPWYCIAVSGETRDGREIKPEWLTDADETYDADNAEALLWREHSRWYDPGGAVAKTKAEKLSTGQVKLFAQLRPTAALLYESAHTEMPFRFSVELRQQRDGKYYLDGLGYTHSPASKGVDRMEFSQHRPDVVLGDDIEIEKLEFSEAKRGLFSRLFNRATDPKQPLERSPKDEDMTPEQFSELKTLVGNFAAELGKEIAELKTAQGDFSKMETALADLKQDFSKQVETQAHFQECLDKIGNSSTGTFNRRQATGQGNAVASFKDFGM